MIMGNGYLLFIGIAFFLVAGIDLVHTLAYKGIGVFPAYGANLPTQHRHLGGRSAAPVRVLLPGDQHRRSLGHRAGTDHHPRSRGAAWRQHHRQKRAGRRHDRPCEHPVSAIGCTRRWRASQPTEPGPRDRMIEKIPARHNGTAHYDTPRALGSLSVRACRLIRLSSTLANSIPCTCNTSVKGNPRLGPKAVLGLASVK